MWVGGNRGEVAGRRVRARATARRREGRWAGLSLIVAVVLVGIAIIDGGDRPPVQPWSLPTGSLGPLSVPTGSFKPEPAPEAAEDLLPSSGPGTYRYESTAGPVLGGGGPITRFRLAVESNLDSDLGE